MPKPGFSKEEMLAKMRKKMEERKAGRRDPDQFIPPKAAGTDVIELYFRVLPDLQMGDTCKGGTAEQSSELWYYENGSHFIDNQKLECPRMHDRSDCPLCALGFELLQDVTDQKVRAKVAGTYLARSYYAVNVYFLNTKKNPENVRGKVMWFNLPKTLWDKMDLCISNDDPGDQDNPKPVGLFYHPYEGGYTFLLSIRKKGEWNTYEDSKFLPQSVGPLIKNADGTANEEEIQRILDQRMWLPSRFQPRDLTKLEAVVSKYSKQATEGSEDEETEEIASAGVMKGAAAKVSRPVEQKVSKPEKTIIEDDDDGAPALPEDIVEDAPKQVTKAPAPVAAAKAPAAKAPTKPATDEDDPDLADLLSSLKKGK